MRELSPGAAGGAGVSVGETAGVSGGESAGAPEGEGAEAVAIPVRSEVSRGVRLSTPVSGAGGAVDP